MWKLVREFIPFLFGTTARECLRDALHPFCWPQSRSRNNRTLRKRWNSLSPTPPCAWQILRYKVLKRGGIWNEMRWDTWQELIFNNNLPSRMFKNWRVILKIEYVLSFRDPALKQLSDCYIPTQKTIWWTFYHQWQPVSKTFPSTINYSAMQILAMSRDYF